MNIINILHSVSIRKDYFKILVLFFILLQGCKDTSNNTKINKNEDSKFIDSTSYRITSSPKDYPVVHVPFAADSNSERWKGIDLSPQPPVYPLICRRRRKALCSKAWLRYESCTD